LEGELKGMLSKIVRFLTVLRNNPLFAFQILKFKLLGKTANLDFKHRRRKLLESHINISDKKGLEIGPLHAPMYQKTQTNISFADYMGKDQLLTHYKGHPVDFDNIPEIDYIFDESKTITDAVKNQKFDYVIANHVFEHLPNPIRWLKEIEEILETNGLLFMAIPDKRHTFDKNRSDTNIYHLLEDYHTNNPTNLEHILEFRTLVNGLDFKKTYSDTLKEIKNKKNTNLHFHVFSYPTFKNIIRGLLSLNIINYKLGILEDSKKNASEMILILQKTGNKND
jgi:predicted SAM-dependent methyltransferase